MKRIGLFLSLLGANLAFSQNVKFAVIGDYGDGLKQGAADVAALVKDQSPELIITAGDNVYGGQTFDLAVGKNYHEWVGNYTGSYGTVNFGTIQLAPAATLNGSGNNVDSHDWWEHPTDPDSSLLFITGKNNSTIEIWSNRNSFASELGTKSTLVPVNGVAVDERADTAYFGMSSSGGGGTTRIDVYAIHENSPYLTWVRTMGDAIIGAGECNLDVFHHNNGETWIFVSDDFNVYGIGLDGTLKVTIDPPTHRIETLVVDSTYQVIYIPDESGGAVSTDGVYAYNPDGTEYQINGTNRFGQGYFTVDEEGITIYELSDTTGYIIVADQRNPVTDFQFFDRVTWAHLGTFQMTGVNWTDGISVTRAAMTGYADGIFAALDDDVNVSILGWTEILDTLNLTTVGADTNKLFTSIGNHDYGESPNGITDYFDFFTLPGRPGNTSGNERYYNFEWGNSEFFAINSNSQEADGRTSGSTQGSWLQTELGNSTADWQFVYFHHPPYTSGTSHPNETVMQWPFEAWGADAVFNGHNHHYERIHKDADADSTVMLYFVTGNGGRSLYTSFTSPPEPGSQFRNGTDYGAMIVETFGSDSVQFKEYNVAGMLLDSYTLGADTGAPPQPTTNFPIIIDAVDADAFGMDNFGGSGRHLNPPATTYVKVTNRNASGAGSLRDALLMTVPRTIVLEVSGQIPVGTITLNTANSYVTLAGQTAPGPVVMVGGEFILKTSFQHGLFEHVSIVHDVSGSTDAFGARNTGSNYVWSHVLGTWGRDEVASFTHGTHHATVRYSIVAEGPQNAGHSEPNHSRGFHASRINHFWMYKNLLLHNDTRNPNAGKTDGYPATSWAFVNNVVYNYGKRGTHVNSQTGGETAKRMTIYGNKYISGPNTSVSPIEVSGCVSGWQQYIDNNQWNSTVYSTANVPDNSWGLTTGGCESLTRVDVPAVDANSGDQMWVSTVPLTSLADLEADIVANVGPRPVDRGPWTTRYISELQNRTGGIINHPNDVGGVAGHSVPNLSHTLTVPANPDADDDGDGYTNGEEWIHEYRLQVEGGEVTPALRDTLIFYTEGAINDSIRFHTYTLTSGPTVVSDTVHTGSGALRFVASGAYAGIQPIWHGLPISIDQTFWGPDTSVFWSQSDSKFTMWVHSSVDTVDENALAISALGPSTTYGNIFNYSIQAANTWELVEFFLPPSLLNKPLKGFEINFGPATPTLYIDDFQVANVVRYIGNPPGPNLMTHIGASQIGYLPIGVKQFSMPTGFNSFTVVNVSTGQTAFTGGPAMEQRSSADIGNQSVWVGDFTSFQGIGRFKVVAGSYESHPFDIGWDIYDEPLLAAKKTFYYQRAFTAIDTPYANSLWTHATDASLAPASVVKGWHDAGDYTIYMPTMTESIWFLLETWQDFQPVEEDLNIPESANGIPDLLDEIRWGLEWVLSMQDTGSNGFWGTACAGSTNDYEYGTTLPQNAGAYRKSIAPTAQNTAKAIAVLAYASEVFVGYDSAFSAQCLTAAEDGWTWMVANPTATADADIGRCGAYAQGAEPTLLQSNRMWAAAALLYATNDTTYETAFQTDLLTIGGISSYSLSTAKAGNMYLRAGSAANGTVQNDIRDRIKVMADGVRAAANSHPFQVATHYYWGSLGNAARRVGEFSWKAYRADTTRTQDKDQTLANVHYYYGRNYPTISYQSGSDTWGATNWREKGFHHWMRTLNLSTYHYPGAFPGGANESPDGNDISYPSNLIVTWGYYGDPNYPRQNDGTAVVDERFTDNDSWSTNETAINYNAALVYNLSAAKWIADQNRPSVPLPTGTFSVVPDSLPAGGGEVTLTWTSLNAATASINNDIGAVALNGNTTDSVTLTTTYILTLTNVTGTIQLSDGVTVDTIPPCPTAPTATFTAIPSGLSDSTSYDGCTATISSGSCGTSNAGYTGAGYANTTNIIDVYVEWTVNVSDSGLYDAVVRYANGPSIDRWADLVINGTSQDTVNFPTTGAFTVWGTVGFQVVLDSGANTVRLVAGISSGLANIDKLDLVLPFGGGDVTLTWTSQNADTVRIDQGIGDVALNGDTTVSISSTTTWTLTVKNTEGPECPFQNQYTARVVVGEPPPLPTGIFAISPDTLAAGGGNITLTWTSQNATSASIDQGIGSVALNGDTTINITVSKTFTITFTNVTGEVQYADSVTVNQLPPVLPSGSFSVTPEFLPYTGGNVTLSWAIADADSVVISQGLGLVADTAETTLTVASTTTWALTATNAAGSIVLTALVTVLPQPVITVNSPNGGEVWDVGSQHTIEYAVQNVVTGTLTIELSTNSGSTFDFQLATNAPIFGGFLWTVIDVPDSNARIRVSLNGDLSINDMSDGNFIIRAAAPEPKTIEVTSPVAEDTLYTKTISITTIVSENVNSLRVYWIGSTWQILADEVIPGSVVSLASQGVPIQEFPPQVTSQVGPQFTTIIHFVVPDDTGQVSIRAIDLQDTTVADYSDTFAVATGDTVEAPIVTFTLSSSKIGKCDYCVLNYSATGAQTVETHYRRRLTDDWSEFSGELGRQIPPTTMQGTSVIRPLNSMWLRFTATGELAVTRVERFIQVK